jgi:hypothetical protein
MDCPKQIDTKKLEAELHRLRERLGMGHELKLKYMPGGNEKLSGEVRGNTVYIYDADIGKALDTLRHEFIDYIISSATEATYKKFINFLVTLIEDLNYQKKEEVINELSRLL